MSLYRNNAKLVESYRTDVVKDNCNPQYNQVSVFKITSKELNNIFFKVSLFEKNRQESLPPIEIGHVYLSDHENNSSSAVTHWRQMLKKFRRQVKTTILNT